jgi:hypothetical protein
MDTLAIATRIDTATADELGKVAVALIDRLGQLGREGAEAIHAALEAERKHSSDSTDVDEGLAWIEDAFTEIA